MKLFLSGVMAFLENPKQVLILCIFLGLLGTLFDGTLFRLWQLDQDQMRLKQNIEQTQAEIYKLKNHIKMAHDPKFIEREARDRFDLVDEKDVVFVFAE